MPGHRFVSRGNKLAPTDRSVAKSSYCDGPSKDLDERVAWAVDQICVQLERSALDCALGIGRLVIDTFHGGNLRAWRLRGKSGVTFRKLAQHPSLPISASSLYRAVAIYELHRRLSEHIDLSCLSVSHLREVLSVPIDAQKALLEAAVREHWTVTQLADKAGVLRARRKGGRKAKPALLRAATQVEMAVADLEANMRPGALVAGNNLDNKSVVDSLFAARASIDRALAQLGTYPHIALKESGQHGSTRH